MPEHSEKGGASMLEGEISQINLIERLVELWREQFTGAIRFESDGIIKIIYFKSGDVLSASTNDRADSIDEILMRAGKVSREHVKQALARRKESETLGDAMLNLGYITRKELTWARRVQVVGVIRSIAAWTEGSFTVVADYLPKRDEGTLFPLPQVLVELIVTEQDRQKFDRALNGGEVVLVKSAEFDEVFRRLGLNEDAEAIVSQVDGVRNATEVASASGKDTFNVYKLLQALATLGILQAEGRPQVLPEVSVDEFVGAGVADAADIWDDKPAFAFDETEAFSQPTLEVPGLTGGEARAAESVSSGSTSSWDDEPVESEAPTKSSPIDPTVVAAVPPSQPEPPPLPPVKEEQWGFDEAQIETAQRGASVPAASARRPATQPKRAKVKEGGRSGLLMAVLLVVAVAGAAYGGYVWWQKQQSEPIPAVEVGQAGGSFTTQTAATATAPPAPANTGTIVESTTPPSTAADAGQVVGTTATAPANAAPITTTAPGIAVPNPSPESTAALPVVRPKTPAGRTRLDDMARAYATNPRGQYTVQIQILCDPANLDKLVSSGGSNVWFVPQTIGARACYRVFWGNYATRDEAQRGLGTVPESVRDGSAAVKAVPRGQ